MSTFSGRQCKGAKALHRERKRTEARERQARSEARRVVEAYTDEQEGGEDRA